ncbi:MAG: helicase-exonuclease AddAB subunit AddA [Oscillospiraceae bacterium]|nr:helicase-exonuclease AddAB subunit AddA [Oscillospiraceae bacterium]
MSNVRWTNEQLSAIEARGSTLLVSAAAGSGKTAVLVERLLRRIVDDGFDITRFLIITYTKAAANELRKKIGEALSKYAAEHPENKRVRRNLALVGSARISTVHSFCSWLLKTYGTSLEIAGGFRILDENESRVLLDEVLGSLIEEKYEEGDESFLSLARYISDARSDRELFSSAKEMYRKSVSFPYPEKWLLGMAESYNTEGIENIRDTIWGKEAFSKARELVENSIFAAEVMLHDVDQATDTSEVYHDMLTELCHELSKALCDDWDTMRESLSEYEFKRLPSSRKVRDKSGPERIKELYGKIKKDIREGVLDSLMPASSDELLSEISSLSGYMRELSLLALELYRRFGQEKIYRGLLDYSDLEHFAIELVTEDYDEENDVVIPSARGIEVSENFSEILLDEFQDSNIVQDIIFRSVSRQEKNIVMVGDVKQSIYGFRLADPAIFMKKYKTFKRASEASGDEARYITLSRNFRSRAEVLSASNSIFERVMSEKLGGVDYTEEHHLVPRDEIPYSEREDMDCEFCIIDADDENEREIEADARFVAAKISELVNSGFEVCDKNGEKRPVTYKDFAILLRSASSAASVYEKALSDCGIPYISPVSEGLLQKSEVSAIVSFLSVMDNPTRDVALLATLRSPLFSFSADDFCYIRRAGKGSLIDAMGSLAREDSETAKKCRRFLTSLSEMRSLAKGKGISELIWEIYNRTNALGMFGALSYGEERQKNLIEFFKCAEALEKSGYVSLYKFISHIARIAERDGDLASPPISSTDGVTIMTMHKSKGLEFPVVFVANAIRSFNLDDIKGNILFHPKLGAGLRIKDEKLGMDYSSFMRDIIKRKILEDQKSEEMRLLYVALTRAREKLYITTAFKNAARAIEKTMVENAYPDFDKINLASRNDAKLWFLLPILRSATGSDILEYAGFYASDGEKLPGLRAYVVKASEITSQAAEKEISEAKKVVPDEEEIKKMLSFVYPYEAALKTPSKITATGISAQAEKGQRKVLRKTVERPSFIREKKLNAAERGTALHLAMQFADFEKCVTEEGAKAELLRLYEEKYLTKKQYEAVDSKKIYAFVNSHIGREMLSAKKVCREFKFSLLLPGEKILSDESLSGEKLLLQGVIDMYYETDEGITIVDFKTDKNPPEGERLEKYKAQLKVYKTALLEMTGKKANRLVLYLVSTGEFLEV